MTNGAFLCGFGWRGFFDAKRGGPELFPDVRGGPEFFRFPKGVVFLTQAKGETKKI